MHTPQLLVFKERVHICSIRTDALPRYMHVLLPCLLGGSATRFFALTRSDAEVSVLFDESIGA